VKNYVKAAANTRSVGSAVADLLKTLISMGKINLEKLTLIGFSLGAHISGFVGNKIPGIPRILGEVFVIL